MRRERGVLCVVSMLLLEGCTISSVTVHPLPPLESHRLVRGASGASAVTAELLAEERVVAVHVEPARACRVALLRTERRKVVRTRKPNRTAGTLAGAGAGVSAVASVGLFTHLDAFSSHARCDAEGTCRSPRSDATASALLLTGTSFVLTVVSVASFGAKEVVLEEDVGYSPLPSETVTSPAPCGSGPVAELGVSLFRLDERLSATTTDARGDAVLPVPAGISGTLRVVVDAAPPGHELVMPGETLGHVRIEPEAPPAP